MSESVLNAVLFIKRNFKFLFFSNLIIAITTLATLFFIDEIYYSNAIVKYSSSSSSSGLLSNIGLGNLDKISSAFGFGAQNEDLEYLIAIGSSRSIIDTIINQFGFYDYYESNFYEDCRKQFLSNTVFEINSDAGLIEIGFFDKDKILAQTVVRRILQLLESKIGTIQSIEASYYREIIEERYYKNLTDLKNAEEKMRTFQETTGVFLPEEQVKFGVEISAEFESKKMLLEMEQTVKKQLYGNSFPGNEEIELQINEIQKKIKQINEAKPNEQMFGLFPMKKSPQYFLEYFRLYRELTIQAKLLEIVYPLYEQAILSENEKNKSLVIVDQPNLPDKRSKPKRMLTLAIVMLFSLTMTLIASFTFEQSKLLIKKLG